MNQSSRLVVFFLLISGLGLVYYIFGAEPAPNEATANTVIFASLIMLSFAVLLLEHWFTKPTDAIASAIAILLTLLPSKSSLGGLGYGLHVLAAFAGIVLLAACVSILLTPLAESSDRWNRLAKGLKNFAALLGSARVLFAALFFLSLFAYVDRQAPYFIALTAYAGLVLTIDPKRLPSIVFPKIERVKPIGEVIGVQSRNTILAKLANNRETVRRYDFVEFADAGDENRSRKGIIIDNWVLNSEQWIKVFSGSLVGLIIGNDRVNERLKAGKIYKIVPKNKDAFLERFVGTVYEGSEILSIKFDYGMRVPVVEGTLLQIPVDGKNILYQVTYGVTRIEKLDAKNEAGLIIGQASQIGVWNPEIFSFDRFGWVPEMNKPVLLAEDINEVPAPPGEMEIGKIPATNYPVFMKKNVAVNCHLAIIGVTGTGKSVFARNLLRTFARDGVKVVAVDFTGEYRTKLADVLPKNLMTSTEARPIFDNIDWISNERTKFANQQNLLEIAKLEREIRLGFEWSILRYLYDSDNLVIFELPDVSNSNSILSYTRWFFKVLFDLARDNRLDSRQFCVTLEEAHTVVPEWNFLSTDDKSAKALLNQIAQIALQGRKYGVGFVVIAQRTANVSKTVLTQCNTIIAFQQFDRTSSDFLSNYVGTEMAEALQNLRPRQTVAVGKAFRSGLPTIFEVPEIIEP